MCIPEANTEGWKNPQDLKGEKWALFKTIDTSTYYVSNYGRVKTTGSGRGTRILYVNTNSQGYYRVNIRGKFPLIHRLVAKAFCEHPEGKDVVDHINSIKTDNRAENLRWVDYRENLMNPITKERRLSHTTSFHDGLDGVIYKVGATLPFVLEKLRSIGELCEMVGLSEGTIKSKLRGGGLRLGGAIYAYAEDYPKVVEKVLKGMFRAEKSAERKEKPFSDALEKGIGVVLGNTEP